MNTNSSHLTSTLAGIALCTLTASIGMTDAFALGYPTKPTTGASAPEARRAPGADEARPGQRPLPTYGTAREHLAVLPTLSCPRSAYCQDHARGIIESLSMK